MGYGYAETERMSAYDKENTSAPIPTVYVLLFQTCRFQNLGPPHTFSSGRATMRLLDFMATWPNFELSLVVRNAI